MGGDMGGDEDDGLRGRHLLFGNVARRGGGGVDEEGVAGVPGDGSFFKCLTWTAEEHQGG